MKRATMRSGAFMTHTAQGMVRGCRACKAPLSAELQCPRCKPKACQTWEAYPNSEHPACKACGYQICSADCKVYPRTLAGRDALARQLEAERAALEDNEARKWMQAAYSTVQAQPYAYPAGLTLNHGCTYNGQNLATDTATTATYAPNGLAGLGTMASNLGAAESRAIPHTPANFAQYVLQRAGQASK